MNLFTFPRSEELTKKGDEFLLPSKIWAPIPDNCLDAPIGENIVRRPVVSGHQINDLLATAEDIRKTAKNLGELFGIKID